MIKKIFFTFFFSLPVFAFSQNRQVTDALKKLDACIEKRSEYEASKIQRIKKLESKLENDNIPLANQYKLYAGLYNEYQSYKYDSAYSFAGKMLGSAQKLNDKNRIVKSKIALGFSCMSAGLYKEASEISASINFTGLSDNIQVELYSFLSTLNLNMSYFSASEPYHTEYKNKSFIYCKKWLVLSPIESSEYHLAKIREYQFENNYVEAIRKSEQYLSTENIQPHDYAIVASTLGYFYQIQKDTTKAILYFASAAIEDIKMATKETAAIRQLAELLYKKGDIQHAYSYANLALDDANFYNARQRKIEVGQILPIIEAGRFQIIKEQKDKLLIYSGLISILFALVLIATIIILNQKKRLNSARLLILEQNNNLLETNKELTEIQKKISNQNLDLLQINERLKEVHRIKDEYIGYFFQTNSSYLEKIDNFRKMVARKIRNGQFNELSHLNETSDLRKEREEMFASFDQIFIRLFPDFVDRYNQLFKEEDRVAVKASGMLAPEIRIFALIRLGITESERIAKFLDFSLSTVKNYKTKAKNRSVISNELFEQKIMEIESVKTNIKYKND